MRNPAGSARRVRSRRRLATLGAGPQPPLSVEIGGALDQVRHPQQPAPRLGRTQGALAQGVDALYADRMDTLRTAALALAALLCSGCSTLAIDCEDPEASGWDPAHASLEEEMLQEVNARREAGAECRGVAMPPVATLTMDPTLRCAARSHSVDMVTRAFFSHDAPGGGGPADRVTAAGYEWSTVSENIAAGRPDAATTVQDLIESTTGHCENILDGNVVHAGMGLAMANDEYGTYWTQVFAAPQ